MNKKIILTSLVCGFASTAAMADGIYISPKISLNTLSVQENRTELAFLNGAWSEFSGNKHESWSGDKTQVSPKFAVGYDFDLGQYGIVSVEAEYGAVKNYFNGVGLGADLSGSIPNDSDTRNFTYRESTISLNAKYGYDLKYVVPFVTAGIGYSTIDSQNNFRSGTYWWETTDQSKNISWNIGAGVEVPVTERLSVSLSYLYTDLGDMKYSNAMYHNKGTTEGIERVFESKVELYKQEVLAGVKISF